MLDLNTLYQQLDKHYYSNGEEFVSVQDVLQRCLQEDIALLPGSISPYYLTNHGIYELYWLDLLIEPSDGRNFETFVLESLRATSLDDIEPDLLELNRRSFIKMTGNIQQDNAMFVDYLTYLLSHEEMKDEIRSIFGSYDERYLYVSFYTEAYPSNRREQRTRLRLQENIIII